MSRRFVYLMSQNNRNEIFASTAKCNETVICGPHTACVKERAPVYVGDQLMAHYLDIYSCICKKGLTGDAYNTTVGCSTGNPEIFQFCC